MIMMFMHTEPTPSNNTLKTRINYIHINKTKRIKTKKQKWHQTLQQRPKDNCILHHVHQFVAAVWGFVFHNTTVMSLPSLMQWINTSFTEFHGSAWDWHSGQTKNTVNPEHGGEGDWLVHWLIDIFSLMLKKKELPGEKGSASIP